MKLIVPCKNCLLIPVCRYKNIGTLLSQCKPFHTFMMDSNIGSKRARVASRRRLVRSLKPTTWKLNKNGYSYIPQKRMEVQIWPDRHRSHGLKKLIQNRRASEKILS